MNALELYLLGGIVLFCTGVLLVITRRNAIMALMGIELMLNAANLNFVVFARQRGDLTGQAAAVFVMVLAAAEVAVALAIVINAYRRFRTVHVDEVSEMKG